RRHQRIKIRVLYGELLLIYSVQSQRGHGQALADALVKDSVAATKNGLRLLAAGRPRKTEPRRKVESAVDVLLVLVTQARAQREVGTNFPIVLHVAAKVPLAHLRFRITGRQTKLSRAAAESA